MEQQEARRRSRSLFRRNDHSNAIWVCIPALAFVLICTVVTVAGPARSYSESENRMLAQMPAVSRDALFDGSWFAGLESAFADQFPGRDSWIAAKLRFDCFFGAQQSSGVYLGKEGYLIQQPSDPNEAALTANLEAMKAFCKDHLETAMYVTLVPNAVTVLADKLPANAPVPDQRMQLDEIRKKLQGGPAFVDVCDALLAHREEALYYRTDHHWTSLGARYGFEAMAPALKIQPGKEYRIYTVSDSFEGTLAARSGCHIAQDRVQLYVPQPEPDYKVVYSDSGAICASLYDRTALETRDHYTVFFGGNHPRIDITTTVENQRRLLIFKDSYANCFVQFLTPYFEQIILVDPRYYYDDVSILMKQNQITDVLFLYNLDTFLGDSSLSDVLGAGE